MVCDYKNIVRELNEGLIPQLVFDVTLIMSEIRNLTRNGETFYPLTHADGILDPNGEYIGYYAENPEYVRVIADHEGKILAGIKTDGSIEWSIGIPQPVKEEILKKVDKEEGMGLINSDYASSQSVIESPEFIEVETDNDGKILAGRATGGMAFEKVGLETPKISIGENILININDPENRSEITLDNVNKVIAYRKKDGTKVENAGIETSKLILTDEGLSDLEKDLKDHGFSSGQGDWSDAKELHIAEPYCARVNFIGIDDIPQTKGVDIHGYMQFWDMNGNYFKKEVIMNAQGNSSLLYPKKNIAIDICNNNGWDDDDTFDLKIGSWVSQDSFHLKAYYTDYFVGIPAVGYQLFNEMLLSRNVHDNRNWKRALLPANNEIGYSRNSLQDLKPELKLDNGARCFPDGFPCIVYLNGDFYGIYSWQLKKHRKNYNQEKDNGKHIHLDGSISSENVWSADGSINWYKWSGIIPEEEGGSRDGVEFRNPKDLILRDGSTYNQDILKQYPPTVEITKIELVGEENEEYSELLAAAESIPDEKKRKKRIKQIKYTNAVKKSLVSITRILPTLISMEDGGSTEEEIRNYIADKFDIDALIDFQIFSDISANIDGVAKNWQWNTWDGEKWFCSPYDLDWTFGLMGLGELAPLDVHVGNNRNLPCYWVIKYYNSELNTRYTELRDKGIIKTEKITHMLSNWIWRVDTIIYEKEDNKWPDRGVDNIYRFYNWCKTSIFNMDILYNYNQ